MSLHSLAHFVYERERSKPCAGARVAELYDAARQAKDAHAEAMGVPEPACQRRAALQPVAEAAIPVFPILLPIAKTHQLVCFCSTGALPL